MAAMAGRVKRKGKMSWMSHPEQESVMEMVEGLMALIMLIVAMVVMFA